MSNESRAQFEAWHSLSGSDLDMNDSGNYANAALRVRWVDWQKAWQAGRESMRKDALEACEKWIYANIAAKEIKEIV